MRYVTGLVVLFLFSCSGKQTELVKESKRLSFTTPQHVTVQGYTGHLMEPFISRDGRWLFFNDLNDPSVNTNIYYAERINDTLFQFSGEVQGLNSLFLDGVASMDNTNNLYFISTRTYTQNYSTVYRGLFTNGSISQAELVAGISKQEPGLVDFDVEISADGQAMYFSEGHFNQTGQPLTADIILAGKSATGFNRKADSETILRSVNTNELEYAAGISPDELTLFFTRLPAATAGMTARLYYATRDNKTMPFNVPRLVEEVTGFTEAISFSGDNLLYFHKRDIDYFQLYCIKKL
ncbi:MAG: hypothetical protein ABL876_10925 [Chitinophagaceae bacterium]